MLLRLVLNIVQEVVVYFHEEFYFIPRKLFFT